MADVSLRLLGRPEIGHGGAAVTFATRKATAMLAYLVIEGAQPRDRLAALLWPDSDETRASASLRRGLAYLRDGLGRGHDHLRSRGQSIEVVEFDTDLRRLERALNEADLDALIRVIEGWRGELLDGLALDESEEFAEWLERSRRHWTRQAVGVAQQAVHRLGERGLYPQAQRIAGVWLAREPLDEAAHQSLIRIHLSRGDRGAAVDACRACRRALAEGMGLEPSPETVDLERLARSAPQATSWPAPAAPASADVPMVSRSTEHARLAERLSMAVSGSPQAVLVLGQAGIGKSRLGSEFTSWAEATGARVFRARAYETAGALPYQPFADALRAWLVEEGGSPAGLSVTWLAALASIIPELRELRGDVGNPMPGSDTAVRISEAICRAVRAAAAERPVLFWFDDVHWADTATLDALVYCAGHLDSSPAFLLLAARDDELTTRPQVGTALEQVARSLPCPRLELHTLTEDAVAELLRGWDGPRADISAHDVLRLSGGLPLLIVETIRYWSDGGGRQLAPGAHSVVVARLRRLDDGARSLALASAVLERGTSFEALAEIADLDSRPALRGLEDGLNRRVLVEAAGGYAVAHDILRQALIEGAVRERLVLLHQRALVRLERDGAPASELARHAEAAGESALARGHHLAAGLEALRLFDGRTAIPHLNAGLDGPLSDNHLGLGRAYELADDREAALAVYQRVAEEAADVDLRSLALLRMALLHGQSFDPQTPEFLDRALTASRHASPGVAAEVGWAVGQLTAYRLELTEARAHADRALSAATEAGRQDLEGRVLNLLAFIGHMVGDWPETIGDATRAVERLRGVGDRLLELDSLAYWSIAETFRGRHVEGRAIAESVLGQALELDNRWGESHASFALGRAALDAGDYLVALTAAQRGVDIARDIGFAPLELFNLVTLAAVHRALLDTDSAADADGQAIGFGQRLGALADQIAHEGMCATAVLRGDWDEAASQAIAAEQSWGEARLLTGLSLWAEQRARCRAGLLPRPAETIAPGPRLEVQRLRAEAALADEAGQVARAAEITGQAAGCARSLSLPGEEWPARMERSRALGLLGKSREAGLERRRAVDILDELTAPLPSTLGSHLREKADGLRR